MGCGVGGPRHPQVRARWGSDSSAGDKGVPGGRWDGGCEHRGDTAGDGCGVGTGGTPVGDVMAVWGRKGARCDGGSADRGDAAPERGNSRWLRGAPRGTERRRCADAAPRCGEAATTSGAAVGDGGDAAPRRRFGDGAGGRDGGFGPGLRPPPAGLRRSAGRLPWQQPGGAAARTVGGARRGAAPERTMCARRREAAEGPRRRRRLLLLLPC